MRREKASDTFEALAFGEFGREPALLTPFRVVTVHPTLLFLTLLTASPAGARTPAHEALHTQCVMFAADPQNPWALAHGITGIGKNFAASDGRRAADVIVHDFLKKGADPRLTGYSFDKFGKDGTPIEPHTNLNVKTLVLAGYPLSQTFDASFGKVTLQQMVDGVKQGFHHAPQVDEYWRDAGWTLDLLAHVLKPGPSAVFKNGAGEQVDFNKVMSDALTYLETSQPDLLAAMDKGVPEVPKRKQGIYAHPCGGLHLVQAVAHWARYPAVRKAWGKRWDRQVQLLFWRLNSEQRQYDTAYQAAPQGYRLLILTQMVKFYGHFLETTGRMKAEGSHTFTKAEKAQVARAQAFLDHTVRELQTLKAFDQMEAIKRSQRQVYLDLIGDSCHATHGLDLWQ